jgi:biotin carboxyl carrier protein
MKSHEETFGVEIHVVQLRATVDEYGVRFEGDDCRVPVIDGERLRSFLGLLADGSDVPIYVEEVEGRHRYIVYLRGEAIPVTVTSSRDDRLRALGKNAAAGHSLAQMIAAPMPGMLKEVLVTEGQLVNKGDTVCILEAMKMENEIKAPARLLVKRVIGRSGTAVEKGAPLLELRPEAD